MKKFLIAFSLVVAAAPALAADLTRDESTYMALIWAKAVADQCPQWVINHSTYDDPLHSIRVQNNVVLGMAALSVAADGFKSGEWKCATHCIGAPDKIPGECYFLKARP